ncbi:MAG: alpha/beta hydrolase family protein [Solirubrobacteraceae bacterium]
MPSPSVDSLLIGTPLGEARVHLASPEAPAVAALVLGHGAGGGVSAPDLLTAQGAALEAGLAVVLVEQPYRVAGRRSAPPAARLDIAWVAVLERLRERELAHAATAIVVGGRSSGARVACRTARATAAIGVLCLAFPLQPPARAGAARVAPSRQPELDGVTVPTLVIQGVNDRFGMPTPAARREVVTVSGDHGLKRDLPAIGAAGGRWLNRLTPRAL